MANPNPDMSGLKPVKPGEVRNPNGRPKGRRSLSTIIRDMLEENIDWQKLPIAGAEKLAAQFNTKKGWEAIVMVAFTQAMSGDSKAREWLRKAGYGDRLDIMSDGKALPTPILGAGVINVPSDNSADKDSSTQKAD